MMAFNKTPSWSIHMATVKKRPYHRTMESIKKRLSNALTKEKPKKAVDIIYEEKGGLLNAKSAGQLPHSRDQAYYLKKKQQQKAVTDSVVNGSVLHCFKSTCNNRGVSLLSTAIS